VGSVGLGSLGLPGGLAGVAASWVDGESMAGEAGAVDGHGGLPEGVEMVGVGWVDVIRLERIMGGGSRF
jgi:hypothetical protein